MDKCNSNVIYIPILFVQVKDVKQLKIVYRFKHPEEEFSSSVVSNTDRRMWVKS
jgi:hypothetical protein